MIAIKIPYDIKDNSFEYILNLVNCLYSIISVEI